MRRITDTTEIIIHQNKDNNALMKEYEELCKNYKSLVAENVILKQKRETEERENAECATRQERDLERARKAREAKNRRQKMELDSIKSKIEVKEMECNDLQALIEGQLNKC